MTPVRLRKLWPRDDATVGHQAGAAVKVGKPTLALINAALELTFKLDSSRDMRRHHPCRTGGKADVRPSDLS